METYLPEQFPHLAKQLDFTMLSMDPEEAANFYQLPKITVHKDPFDRMLIWQAISRNLVLLSKDEHFEQYSKYGLKTTW